MIKKILALCLSTGMVLTALSGYTANAADSSTSETSLIGQVTAISDSSITLALGTEKAQENKGAPPTEAASNSTDAVSSATKTAPQTDSTASNSGTATAPPTDGTNPGGLTHTGESKTIIVSDSTVITIDNMGKSASGILSDITVGSILTVKMSGDTVTAVTIRQAMTGNINNASQGPYATATSSTITVNGSKVSFQAYNINDNNYFKLRDLAAALSDTDKQFEVDYDSTNNAITLKSGENYTAVGGELSGSAATSNTNASVSTAVVYLDGSKISLTAYNIGGYNYFKLRDVAAALDF